MNKKEEMLVLSLNLLRLGPLYRWYTFNQARVHLEWDKPNNSVTLNYFHHEIHCYSVKVDVYKEDDVAKAKLTHLEVPRWTPPEQKLLGNKNTTKDFYQLLGVISRTVWENNATTEDTATCCVRDF